MQAIVLPQLCSGCTGSANCCCFVDQLERLLRLRHDGIVQPGLGAASDEGASGPPSLPRGVGLDSLLPLPGFKARCGRGLGLAVWPAMGLIVTSSDDDDTISVFALPTCAGGEASTGLSLMCTLGGAASTPPLQFKFISSGSWSGALAFTGPATSRLLLVSDAGHDAVHVVDVIARVHVGYVAAPGSIAGPRGVTARQSQVAVSAWNHGGSGSHVIHLFEGSGASWARVRVLGGLGGTGAADGQLSMPEGLRFTSDGTGLVVAEWGNGRVSMFLVGDGSFVRHVVTGLSHPLDVEECQGGWLVACFGSDSIEFVGGAGRATLGQKGSRDGRFRGPGALALTSIGLLVREKGDNLRMQLFG
jgi:hypothetical protein